MQDELQKLHARFLELTNQNAREVPYACYEWQWYEFKRMGWTEQDLEIVITYLKHENAKASEARYRTKFYPDKILNPQYFAGRLGTAGPWWRNRVRPPTEKAKTLAQFRSTHPEPEPTAGARSFKDVLREVVK